MKSEKFKTKDTKGKVGEVSRLMVWSRAQVKAIRLKKTSKIELFQNCVEREEVYQGASKETIDKCS